MDKEEAEFRETLELSRALALSKVDQTTGCLPEAVGVPRCLEPYGGPRGGCSFL